MKRCVFYVPLPVACGWLGVVFTNAYTFLIGMANSSACNFCGCDDATALLLWQCQSFDAQRCGVRALRGKYPGTLAKAPFQCTRPQSRIARLEGDWTVRTLLTVSEHSSASVLTKTASLLYILCFYNLIFPISPFQM